MPSADVAPAHRGSSTTARIREVSADGAGSAENFAPRAPILSVAEAEQLVRSLSLPDAAAVAPRPAAGAGDGFLLQEVSVRARGGTRSTEDPVSGARREGGAEAPDGPPPPTPLAHLGVVARHVGTSVFLRQHVTIARLNIAAHQSVLRNGDEFVVEAVWTFAKLPLLVTDLLATELWRTHAFPHLLPSLASNKNVLRTYFTLYHECTLIDLIGMLLYHRHAVEALGEVLVDLIDYCARQLRALAVPEAHNAMVRRQRQPTRTGDDDRTRLHSRTPDEELAEHVQEIEYRSAVGSVAIARYLCEHIDALPLSAQTRILDTHDWLVMLVPLVEEPPWTRKVESGSGWQKYMDNGWKDVAHQDLLAVTKCEAQCWLALFHLTCSPVCREQYGFNSFRKAQLLRLRKFLTEPMVDQLPVLADLCRYMDELSIMDVPENCAGRDHPFLLQQVAVVRDSLMKHVDWEEVARAQFREIFSVVTDTKDQDLILISDLFNIEGIEDVYGYQVEEVQDPLSRPVKHMSLSFRSPTDETPMALILMCSDGSAGEVDTAAGKFCRWKMEQEKNNKVRLSHDISEITCTVSYEGDAPFVVEKICRDLGLPATKERDTGSKSRTKKRWIQLGSVEEKLVVQVGLHCHGKEDQQWSLELGQVFLSQPLPL